MSLEVQLRQRIELLEEENRQLRELLVPVETLPKIWGLSRSETRMVIAIARAKGCLSKDRIRIAIGAFRYDPGDKTLEVLLLRARRKLASFGVIIHTVHGVGLTMTPANRLIVLKALDAIVERKAA